MCGGAGAKFWDLFWGWRCARHFALGAFRATAQSSMLSARNKSRWDAMEPAQRRAAIARMVAARMAKALTHSRRRG